MDTILPLQKTVGVLALDHDIRRLEARLVPFQVVQDLVGEAVALGPAGIHPVEHLAPVLGLCAAGTGVKAHQGIVLVIMAGEQGLQAAGLHLLLQDLEALLQFLQHGVVVFLGGHFADGHHVLPGGDHFLVALDLGLGLLDLDGHLLALLRVVPEAGGLLHGMEPLQLVAHTVHIQRLRQTVQSGAAVVELLLIGVKFNIHKVTPASHLFQTHSFLHYTEKAKFCKGENEKILGKRP